MLGETPIVQVPGSAEGGGGGAPTDATYITQTAHASLSNEQALAALASGVVKNTTGTGVLSVATVDTAEISNDAVTYAKIQNVSATDKVLGRSTAGAGDVEEIACTAAGRALLDDADAAAQRTTLGLGTIATQAANNVSITGGSVTGITDLAIADGGTGQSTATAAFDALAPTTTQGDLIYHNGTDNVRLAKGTKYQTLRINSGATAPEWVAPVYTPLSIFHTIGTWTNMPAAKTEILGTVLRSKIDLTEFVQVQLHVFLAVAGVAGAVLFAEYSTNDGVAWSTLTTNQVSLTTAGHQLTAWESIPAGALGNVIVRVVGQNGDGAADPIIANVEVRVR